MTRKQTAPRLKSQTRPTWPLALAAASLAASALLAARGGGSGGSDASASQRPTVAFTSIRYAQGAVSGFGSVVGGGLRGTGGRALAQGRTVDVSGVLPAERPPLSAGAIDFH